MTTPLNLPIEMTEFEFENWRARFLRTLLILLCVFGLIQYASVFPQSSATERWIFGASYLMIIVVTVGAFPYRIKTVVLLAFCELIGLYSLLHYGPWSDAIIFLLASCIFASLLLTKRVDVVVLGVNTVILAFAAGANLFGVFQFMAVSAPVASFYNWLNYIADFFVLGVIIVWSIDLLKTEFRSVVEQYDSAVKLLTHDRAELEQRVDERTVGLTKKTDQLRAASFIARQTAEAQDLSTILNTVVTLITDQFGFYHAGIFLVNEAEDELILHAASSEGGRHMVDRGYGLRVGEQGIIGYVAYQKRPRIALDVGPDAVFFNSPDLSLTRSEVALPLMIREKLLGVLDIQSDQPRAFQIEDLDVLQTLADQVAVAIENARLLGEAQAALTQLEAFTNLRTRESWAQHLQDRKRAFTYTPMGLRAEDFSQNEVNGQIKASIKLRGQKIGAIALSRKDQADWNKLDEELLNEVANQVGLAADSLRLLEDAQQRARREQTVGELATRFSQSLDIDGLLQTAAREMGQLPDVSEVSIYIGQMPEQNPPRRRSKRTTG